MYKQPVLTDYTKLSNFEPGNTFLKFQEKKRHNL